MEKLRTGIIGCGKVGDFHAKVYAELPQSEFVAVCDADSARAEAFASRYGVKAYTDVATMCRDARLDVVSICTPHPLHASPAVAAADCVWLPALRTATPSSRRRSVIMSL